MPEIIRVDVVEHVYDPSRSGKIKKAVTTPEQKREREEKKEARDQVRQQAKKAARMKSGLVYGSMAFRKAAQLAAMGVGHGIDNSYGRQIFDASISGNIRQAQVLQNQKVVSRAKLDFYSNLANFAGSAVAGFSINTTLGLIQTVGYVTQLSAKLIQDSVMFQEQMRQFNIQMQKQLYESEYNRDRLIKNTYQNRGLGL